MIGSSRTLVLVTIPTLDREFAAFAHDAADDARSTEELERALRRRYPRAAVHSRTLWGELQMTWYAFRDGSWRPPARPAPGR